MKSRLPRLAGGGSFQPKAAHLRSPVTSHARWRVADCSDMQLGLAELYARVDEHGSVADWVTSARGLVTVSSDLLHSRVYKSE